MVLSRQLNLEDNESEKDKGDELEQQEKQPQDEGVDIIDSVTKSLGSDQDTDKEDDDDTVEDDDEASAKERAFANSREQTLNRPSQLSGFRREMNEQQQQQKQTKLQIEGGDEQQEQTAEGGDGRPRVRSMRSIRAGHVMPRRLSNGDANGNNEERIDRYTMAYTGAGSSSPVVHQRRGLSNASHTASSSPRPVLGRRNSSKLGKTPRRRSVEHFHQMGLAAAAASTTDDSRAGGAYLRRTASRRLLLSGGGGDDDNCNHEHDDGHGVESRPSLAAPGRGSFGRSTSRRSLLLSSSLTGGADDPRVCTTGRGSGGTASLRRTASRRLSNGGGGGHADDSRAMAAAPGRGGGVRRTASGRTLLLLQRSTSRRNSLSGGDWTATTTTTNSSFSNETDSPTYKPTSRRASLNAVTKLQW